MATDVCLPALMSRPLSRTLAEPVTSEWGVAVLHNLTQIQDLLDWLENHGIGERQVTALDDTTFAVRWR